MLENVKVERFHCIIYYHVLPNQNRYLLCVHLSTGEQATQNSALSGHKEVQVRQPGASGIYPSLAQWASKSFGEIFL